MRRTGMKGLLAVLIGVTILSCIGILLVRRPGPGGSNIENNVGNAAQEKEGQKVKEDTRKNKIDYSSFQGLQMDKDDIKIKLEGKNVNLTLPVYVETNRYYLPLTEFVDKLDGKYTREGSKVRADFDGRTAAMDIDANSFEQGGKSNKLRRKSVVSGDIVYISLYDLTRMLDLKTDWDFGQKTISLFWNREKLEQKQVPESAKQALIRLEDVAAASFNDHYSTNEDLIRLRAVADYLYTQNVPFHVAWVPRFIDPRPEVKQDNDPSTQYSMYNTDFIFTLDYMADKNGIIGLHGYTHQYGSSISIGGVEFGGPAPSSDKYADERINQAIDAAKKLDIPYGFFEFPHYAAADNQYKVAEKYFDIIYEHAPGVYGSKIVEKKNGDRTSRYIPANLDYLNGKGDLKRMIGGINGLGGALGSFFYHPWIEFEDINITKDASGYPSYTYADTSALHQLFKAFEAKGYRFVNINQVK